MRIDDLRKIRNKNVGIQNELTYLEMKQCVESFDKYDWLKCVLSSRKQPDYSGILIRISDTPEQGGRFWYGTWLSSNKAFYEFIVVTDDSGSYVIEVEVWKEVLPEISGHKKGIGKTKAYIALELLSEYEKS